ncbi:MAG: 2-hydroxymuconic semialdehyde dehydrogenase [Candidatus Marinimicrobia bacterium]|nr:2-hydroxymuconic semialdehyde dehydrogenase [Candidatus Neomarinimicrobiota bacterium]
MKKIFNYIDGKLAKPEKAKYIDVFNPSRGKIYARCPESTSSDLKSAVTSATKAFNSWREFSNEQRSKILFKIADEIEKRKDEFALAETIDNGKPLSDSKNIDIPRAINNLRFYASAVINNSSESHSLPNSVISYTLRDPLGIVACISPWNYPLHLLTWKIAPALAIGNCVIAKPSEVTPMTAYLFSKVCIKAGLPKGVLNILHGSGHLIGQEIVEHPDIKAISFTGGTKTGKIISKTASSLLKKVSLELGGKNPIIVFDDCDYKEMLKSTIRSSFGNQGQICLCGERIFVQESIYDKFKKDFIREAKKLKIGDPLKSTTNQGSIVSKEHYDKILSYFNAVKDSGAKFILGGSSKKIRGNCSNGWFIEPSIVEDLSRKSKCYKEEAFGPITSIHKFRNKSEAIRLANETKYGLSASIWTSNLKAAHQVAKMIDFGIIWVNAWNLRDLRTPFGGMKDSGLGREGGNESMRFFSEPKNVCINYS